MDELIEVSQSDVSDLMLAKRIKHKTLNFTLLHLVFIWFCMLWKLPFPWIKTLDGVLVPVVTLQPSGTVRPGHCMQA